MDTDTRLDGGYDRLSLGVNFIAASQTDDVTVFYDDLVVDTNPVPCN